ncbi:hypothetical protein N7539_007847 [Penicillium diatomitis]|uniref:Uncharacterized protein n=1 Tax=Penicillium diatomitis TaxID=2819901 RepID=A0A9W9WU55_9EURO|nr:uncharacterized protein N7539_007847 [Penicillium diatomitis]KAJ5475560.1 hypothetical protein N7539_007847 [Penicillium diatomitis]
MTAPVVPILYHSINNDDYHIMFASTYPTRSPPPVRPSRSLEGLEQVIPPTLPATTYNATSTSTTNIINTTTTTHNFVTSFPSNHTDFFPPTHYGSHRYDIALNKPLPARPILFDEPEISVMWSDSSDSESDDDDHESLSGSLRDRPRDPRHASECYPIFVSTSSDDCDDTVDRHAPANSNPGPDYISLGLIHSPSPPTTVEEMRSRTDSILSLSHRARLAGENSEEENEEEEEEENDDDDDEVQGVVEDEDEDDNEEGLGRISGAVPVGRSLISKSDVPYGRYSQWSQTQTRGGTNHYFREKKWDFFPELAPSAAQSGSRVSTTGPRATKSRRKDGRLNVSKRRKWQSLDRAGLGLAFGMRDSIKTYVHRTLSRDSSENKTREVLPRPSTAPVEQLEAEVYPKPSENVQYRPKNDIAVQLQALSITTSSSSNDLPPSPKSPRSFPPRPKQLAVPMTDYQRYGPAIWDTPKKSKSKTSCSNPSSPITDQFPAPSTLTPPHSPGLKLFSQSVPRDGFGAHHGRSGVALTLEGAKKKISKDERRREQLKAQIKLIGPVDPHSYMQSESAWV